MARITEKAGGSSKKHGHGFRILHARFWKLDDTRKALQRKRGIHVFGIRAGKGFAPIYVGCATGTVFVTECFNKSNLRKYGSALSRNDAKPAAFFVTLPEAPIGKSRRTVW